ncbi:hypothetical protein [Vibrio cortegadensis]|uniref:hypothetical protein n=1 Tax=Vibrio cortegadensis TaxID=1328770 RepID=UPI0021C4B248|nr:hypothetical protein [Vibrio cortegadensis]
MQVAEKAMISAMKRRRWILSIAVPSFFYVGPGEKKIMNAALVNYGKRFKILAVTKQKAGMAPAFLIITNYVENYYREASAAACFTVLPG